VINELTHDSVELMEPIQVSFDHLIRENPMGEARKEACRSEFVGKFLKLRCNCCIIVLELYRSVTVGNRNEAY